ncbi:MAG: ThuA domain-containing protein [Phycisphaerales bacterium]|nr:ThuA domain-containing protein [Phycisphaerales bacterium]
MGFLIICIAAQMILIGAERVLSNMPSATKSASAAQPTEELPRVLVFSKTAGYRHPSIARGIACMQEICGDSFEVVASEDGAQFNDENLKQFRAVVFLSTTGDVLDEPQQAAFEHFIRAGGGWVGIHAAADTEYDWPFYQQVVGAAFKSHPAIQEAVVKVASPRHETTKMLPDDWKRRDEWYTYRASPRNTKDMMILAALDESSYTGGDMNGDHPIAWCHSVDKGRAWYTGGGHTDESFDEPLFREHLRAGVNWVMGDTIKKQ